MPAPASAKQRAARAKFAKASKEASRRVKADPKLDYAVQVRRAMR